MSQQEPLHPAYDFTLTTAPVHLGKGAVELLLNSERFTGSATLLFRPLPSTRLVIRAKVPMDLASYVRFFHANEDQLSLSYEDTQIEGFRGKFDSRSDITEFDWHPRTLPVTLGDTSSQTSVAATLHLFNFPDFRGSQHQASRGPSGRDLLVLGDEDWTVSIQSLPQNATGHAWAQIREQGGCFLTHVAKLERRDGQPFSGDEAREQCWLLGNFLSFAVGGACRPEFVVGLDAEGQTTWSTLGAPRFSKPAYSWFTPFQASQAETLYPLFVKRWKQSDEWQDCLHTAIYWYLQSNTGDGSPGVDSSIILAQAALERLAHQQVVAETKMFSAKPFDQLKASERIRLLATSLNIPTAIGSGAPSIEKVASTVNWSDAPHALTDIRNELVHPVKKKEVASCIVDAWKLSLWYLELSVLAMCGYNGTYTSRMTARLTTDHKKVPWGEMK